MAAPPIYNPVIPCVHPIPAGMYPGRMVRVQGSCPPGAQRFAINLQCGPNTDPRDDIALHLNFRFQEMCVVRNHLTAMNWGVEDTNGGMPLSRGVQFEALVLCEPHALKVALNGAHFCEFPHRIPFQRISHLTVDGDVMIQLISFEGAQPAPQQMYMAEPPAYGAYGQGPPPPAYGAPGGYGQQVQRAPPTSYPVTQPQGFVPQRPAATTARAGKTRVAKGVKCACSPGTSPSSARRSVQDPQYGQQPQMMQQGQMQQGQQRRGMGLGGALATGAAGLAAGGLAGYAVGGGHVHRKMHHGEFYPGESPSQEGLSPTSDEPPPPESDMNMSEPDPEPESSDDDNNVDDFDDDYDVGIA